MELFGLVFLIVALILIGVGIAVGLAACCVVAILVGVGVVSSSVVVGLLSRSSVAGVRAFLLQCGVLAGIPAGVLCAWIARSIFEAYGSGWLVFFYGALGGALGGVIIALLVDLVFRRMHRWTAAKLSLGTRDRPAIQEV